MSAIVVTYLTYVLISAVLTIWVGRTLFVHGRVFLLRVFKEDVDLTNSVNRLLLVGFYLINFGYVSLALRTAAHVPAWREAIELLSFKIGLVLCVLGGMHFFNLAIFSRLAKRRAGTHDDRLVRAPAVR
jgi:hypothetical protein